MGMNNAATITAAKTNGTTTYPKGELLWDTMDGRLVRFHHAEYDGMVAVYDRNDPAEKELPDLRHPTQVCKAGDRFRVFGK